jgi:fimbrial isopeptide formation D2 family protein
MKTKNTTRASILMFLLFAFTFAKAGLIPVISTTPACHGNDGSVTIEGTPTAMGPFYIYIDVNGLYQADSNVVSSTTFTGLPAGTFQFYVSTPNGTNQPGTFTIASAVSAQIATTQPVCPSGTSGSAVVTASGNGGPFSYFWSNGVSGASVTNLPVQVNDVTVTDQNGCSTVLFDTVQIVSPVQATITQTGPACNPVLNASITGGTLPYSYLWSTGQTSASISGLTSYTDYQLQVTDANGCGGQADTVVNVIGLQTDSQATQVVQPTCGSNGSITVVMANGTAPYTYVWSSGATTVTISGLPVYTNYYVTVTDANGCTGHFGYYSGNTGLVENNWYNNPACGTSSGDIQVYAFDGTQPYSYVWSNNPNNNTGFDSTLTAGTYYYTVTDAGGCVITDSVHLIPQGNFSAQVTETPIICPATTGGSNSVTVTPAGTYTYLWSNGATTQTVNNLTEGTNLFLTVTDGNGCQTIASPDSITRTTSFNITVIGAPCASTATATASGGNTGPYTYLWNNGATTATITYNLYQYYEVWVTDAHGCSGYQTFHSYSTGLQMDSFNSIVNPTCNTLGGIKATPLNGSVPYTFAWSNGATTDSIGGLTDGSYQVTVTDANGCSGIGYYYLQGNVVSVYASNSFPTCGTANGAITLYPQGGTPPYSYAWAYNSSNLTDQATAISTGTYSYTVTDSHGCTSAGSDVLHGTGTYISNVTAVATSCNGNLATGGVAVTVTNGGTAPFAFTWQVWNGQIYFDTITSGGFTGLPYGSIVWLESVTDANGCTNGQILYTGSDSSGAFVNYAASCYDDITGYAYTDANGNCVMDQGEPGYSNITVEAISSNGTYYYASTDANGFYDIQVLPGAYTLSAYNYGSCNATTCNSSYTPSFATSGGVSSGNNFGYSNDASFDLVVHTGYNPSTPGSSKEYWVYYYNQGNATANNVVLTFVHDPNLTLTATNPPYSSYNAGTQTITWNLGSIAVSGFNWGQQVTMEFNVPSNLPLGTLLTAYDSITPAVGDCNPANNVQLLSDVVSASHDPNTKEVSPAGNLTPGDSVLNYTIRFQNTGNAAATKIVITDTLSPLVNPSTLVVGASNFQYTYTLSGNGIITFTFSPINLPDSAQSPDSSKGFVSYSVNLRSGGTVGQQVQNTAYIYFDLNPAVVTNTTVSTLSESSVGIRNITAGNMTVGISPNPIHDQSLVTIEGATGEVTFEMNDIAGQKIFEKVTSEPTLIFDSESFAPGIYIYTARDAKGNTCTGKVVVAH